MINRVKNLIEKVISPEAKDVFTRYSKSTPDFKLDVLKSNLKRKDINVELKKQDRNNFYLTLYLGNGKIKDIVINKEDMVKDEIDIEDLILR